MHLMLEVESSKEELVAWATRMDDEEGEEDADELFHSGEEAIDRIVEAMDMDNVSSSLFPLVARFAGEQKWQAKLAALTAVKQTVEYADDPDHIDQMAQLLLQHLDHDHPRVRYTALHAIAQLANDQAPQFQEKSHAKVMPVLLAKMDDQVDRVASMAMSAFVSFGEELDTALMLSYAPQFMEKLVAKLRNSNHRMVKEESITSIAVIAGVIEQDFSNYYDAIMPLLKELVLKATGEKENRLRGKAFECMSLLGIAVGKEKFAADAKEAVEAMIQTQNQNQADDLQREYIKQASERICTCLKQDFHFFLPALLPGIYKNLKLEEDTNSKDDDADNFVTVSTGEGRLVKVHSSKFEELLNAIQLLRTFCTEMEGAFGQWVEPTAQALLPLLTATDEVTMLCDEARSAAFQCWALLIKCAKQNQQFHVAKQLLQTFLAPVCKSIGVDKDPDTIREASGGLAECIKNTGAGCLEQQEFEQIAQMMFKLIDDSLARTAQNTAKKQKEAVGAPTELQPDEDEENTGEDDEKKCRRSLEEVLGALMEVLPDQFVAVLGHCEAKMKEWLASEQNATLALFLACDLLQHLKEKSQTLWPFMFPAIFQALTHKEADIRIPAAYAINLAAPIPAFSEAAAEATKKLQSILNAPAPKKKREEKAKVALDNAVAAMLALAVHKPDQCPAAAFPLILGKLPLKDDEKEAKKVHKLLVDQFRGENPRLVGENAANLPQILKVLAEIYKQENICEKETAEKVAATFKALPPQLLQQHAGGFSEKQQKKIDRIVSS
jgi:AcrR family transcriptional regulator